MQKSDSNAQVPPTLATGAESATGAALATEHDDIPSGEDRGSKVEIVGGPPAPDVDRPKASGAQTEPARYTSNGQLPHNSLASNSGSVPASALGLSVEDTQKRVDEANQAHDDFVASRGTRQRIPPETVRRLHPTEIQAIAEQRGYVLPSESGGRMTRAAFLKAQDEDKEVVEPRSSTRSPGKAKKSAKKASKRSR